MQWTARRIDFCTLTQRFGRAARDPATHGIGLLLAEPSCFDNDEEILRKRKRKEKGKQQTGTLRPFEVRPLPIPKSLILTTKDYEPKVLDIVLEQIAPQVYREEEFIADFLQINDAALTFADYMGLEHYFRRQAAQYAGLSTATMKLVRGALDLIFGFLPTEVKNFIDSALSKDPMYVILAIYPI